MASKVLSAKRREVVITYEFVDGTSTDLIVVSLSTKEGKELAEFSKVEENTGNDMFEKVVRVHLQRNDSKIVNKVMKEQTDGDGNVIEFAKALSDVIEEAKKEKGNG